MIELYGVLESFRLEIIAISQLTMLAHRPCKNGVWRDVIWPWVQANNEAFVRTLQIRRIFNLWRVGGLTNIPKDKRFPKQMSHSPL